MSNTVNLPGCWSMQTPRHVTCFLLRFMLFKLVLSYETQHFNQSNWLNMLRFTTQCQETHGYWNCCKSGPQTRFYIRPRNDLMITKEMPYRVQPAVQKTYPCQQTSREPPQGKGLSRVPEIPKVPQLSMSKLLAEHSENSSNNSSFGR